MSRSLLGQVYYEGDIGCDSNYIGMQIFRRCWNSQFFQFQMFNIVLKARVHCIREVLLLISYFIMAEEYCELFKKWQFCLKYLAFCMHVSVCIHSICSCSVVTGGSATSLSVSVPLVSWVPEFQAYLLLIICQNL